MNVADISTKDEGKACDLWRATMRSGKYTIADEDETLMRRAEERERKKDTALRRQNDAGSAHKKQKVEQELTNQGKKELAQFSSTEGGREVPDEYVPVLAAIRAILNQEPEKGDTKMLYSEAYATDDGMWSVG